MKAGYTHQATWPIYAHVYHTNNIKYQMNLIVRFFGKSPYVASISDWKARDLKKQVVNNPMYKNLQYVNRWFANIIFRPVFALY